MQRVETNSVRIVVVLVATVLAVASSLAFIVEIFPLTADSSLSRLCLLVPCPTPEPIETEGQDARIARLTEAVRREPGSPYTWCDLGEALEESGGYEKADHCMRRAARLGAAIPSVLIRISEFHLGRREDEAALRAMSQILRLVESYDDVVFSYYADIDIPIPSILAIGLSAEARPRQAFFEHSLDWANPRDARLIWDSLAADSITTDQLASRYIDYLIDQGMCDQARQIWAIHLGERKGPYLDSNWLFNGGFEQRSTGVPFDWSISGIEGVRAVWTTEAHSGKSALQLTFEATHNVDYRHLSQIACLSPGQYVFRAWVRTADITTDQAPYFRIRDQGSGQTIDVKTPQLRDLPEWTAIKTAFTIASATTPVILEIRRDSSLKFDNKIGGTLWIDDLSLEGILRADK